MEDIPQRLLVAAAAFCAAGCTVHETGFDEPFEMPEAFIDASQSPIAETGAYVPDEWWLAFDDAELEELQREALEENFNLATFRDRLTAARAIVDRDRSSLFPAFDYSLFARQTRDSDDFESQDQFGAAIVGTYEVDVWERNKNIATSARFNEAVSREQLKAAAVSLTADVAATWYALVEQRGQAAILDQQIETNEQVLRVVRARFGGGVVRASDVLRQQRLVESTREQRVAVGAQIDVLEHALAVLVGRSPTRELGVERDVLPTLPPKPALGLPSEIVQRRPDVRSAYFAIEEADAEIAIAVADRYPSVRLRFEASTIEDTITDLLDNWLALISVDVVGPLFDAGRRKAEVRRTEAVKAERVNVYAQTILVAFRQVLDAVSRERSRDEQIVLIERQLDLAQRTSERLNREYLNGNISYIDVLEAFTTEQQLQRDLLSTRFQRIADRIDLYRALAGGWEGIVPERLQARATDPQEGLPLAP